MQTTNPNQLTIQQLQSSIAQYKQAIGEAWDEFYGIPMDEEFGRQTPEHGNQQEHIKYLNFELQHLEDELKGRVLKPLPKKTY